MKKILVLLAAVVLVMSFAGAALAIHAEIPIDTTAVTSTRSDQIIIGGDMRIRGRYFSNVDSGYPTGDWFDEDGRHKPYNFAKWDQRIRLFMDAKVSPNVQGFVKLETNTDGRDDGWGWGSASGSRLGDAKPQGLAFGILEAWMHYTGSGLFGVPAGLKIGHQMLALSENQFFQHTQWGDDAVVFYVNPTKATHLALITAKIQENSSSDNTDDVDAYVALITYMINDKNRIGANYTYLNHSDNKTKLQNLGLHADGSIGNFGYKGEVDFQFGDMSEHHRAAGWGLMLAVNYKINPVNLRARFASGSGDKAGTEKNEAFQTFVNSSDVHIGLMYDYTVRTAATSMAEGKNMNTGISNTTYFNIGADYTATKDLSFKGDLFILRANNTSMFGRNVSKNLGWEFNAGMTYKLAKNFTYTIDGGYMKTGAFYHDVWDAQDNVTLLRNYLVLNF